MTAMIDRSRQDIAPDLLVWHAEETNRLLKESVTVLFDVILDPLSAEYGSRTVGLWFAPFLDALQEAGDQFDHLYRATTGRVND